jgi:putative FmdB family regulatory protein
MFYDFQCTVCKNEFEKEKSIKDDSNESCPKCGKESLRIISGGIGFLGASSSGRKEEVGGCSPSAAASCPSAHQCGMGCCH